MKYSSDKDGIKDGRCECLTYIINDLKTVSAYEWPDLAPFRDGVSASCAGTRVRYAHVIVDVIVVDVVVVSVAVEGGEIFTGVGA